MRSTNAYITDIECARQTAVKSYLGFYRHEIQSGLLLALNLDEGGRQAVQFVLEHSMTLVLRLLAQENVLATEPQDRKPAQIEDILAPTNPTQLDDCNDFSRVIGSYMPQNLSSSKSNTNDPFYTQCHETTNSLSDQLIENEENITRETSQFFGLLEQDCLDFS